MEKDLRELFEKFAQVREVKVIRNTDTGISKGFVIFRISCRWTG